jgi:hypothetical protein
MSNGGAGEYHWWARGSHAPVYWDGWYWGGLLAGMERK